MGKRTAPPFTEAEINELVACVRSPKFVNLRQLAKERGISYMRLWHLMKKKGVSLEKRGKSVLTREQEELILEKYDNGKGEFVRRIADELGVYHQVVANCLKKHGVEVIWRSGVPFGAKNHKWRGGRRKSGKVMLVKAPPGHPTARSDGYIAEHRLVMEQKLGRYLKPEEVVHHKNTDSMDNRPDNLELYGCNGDHISGHAPSWERDDKGKWLKD